MLLVCRKVPLFNSLKSQLSETKVLFDLKNKGRMEGRNVGMGPGYLANVGKMGEGCKVLQAPQHQL